MSSRDQDPVIPLPETVEVITKEGNLYLMQELVAQSIEFKRKIETEQAEVEKWTKRVQVAMTQPDPALREAAEEKLKEHRRALLQAQMELSGLDDRKAELKFQSRGPSAEQRFRTAQAQHLVAQFKEMGVNPDDVPVERQLSQIAAGEALQALKEKAGISSAIDQLRAQAQPQVQVTVSQSAPPAAPATNGETTPGDIRRGAPLGQELRLKGTVWKRVDALNLGDPKAEEERGLFSEEQPQRVKVESTFPSGRALADEGLVFGKKLSFRLKNLSPGKDALLILRLDVAQKHEATTLIDDAPLAAGRQPEVDPKQRWRHETALIPGAQILLEDIEVARLPKEGTTTNLFAVWVYQPA